LPAFLEPSLALLCEKPRSGPQWIHEIKYDGYRIQARLDGGRVRLVTRKRLDWTKRFPTIATALEGLAVSSALIDGEIVAEDERGIPSFSLLQADLKASRHDRLRYYAFDLLHLDGFDLTDVSLLGRKSLLQQALSLLPAGSPLRYSDHTDQSGATVFAHACQMGLEGIVSKRKDLPYRAGRGQHWLKVKCVQRQEFIILGYVPSTAGAGFVGSLALGFYEKGKLSYAGRVGTGWSNDVSRSLRHTIEQLHAERPAFGKPLPAGAIVARMIEKAEDVRHLIPLQICKFDHLNVSAARGQFALKPLFLFSGPGPYLRTLVWAVRVARCLHFWPVAATDSCLRGLSLDDGAAARSRSR